MLFGGRVNHHAFAGQHRRQPFGGPGALAGVVDPSKRLQGNGSAVAFLGMQRASEILPVAAHAERGSADRSTKIEGEDLAAFVAPELQRHQRQQHGFACPCRANDEAVSDIADMKGKAERGRAFGLAVKQGGVTEMLVPFRSRPYR